MKNGKSPGNDEVVIEMIEATRDFAIEHITKIANKVYNTGTIPNEMAKSIFIAIPKKPGAVECSSHRTIALMSQIGKIVLRVILERIRSKLRSEVAEEQFGFMAEKGTSNAIFTMRMIQERSIEMQKDL